MDQTAARDALLGALHTLAAASPAVLKRAVHMLVDDHDDLAPPLTSPAYPAPDVTTPPTHGATGGAAEVFLPIEPRAAPPTHTERTARRLPAKAAPPKQSPSTKGGNEVTAWMRLRVRVTAEQRRRGLDLDQLAAAIGYAASSTENALKKRSPPSEPMAAKFAAFAAGQGGASSGAARGMGRLMEVRASVVR